MTTLVLSPADEIRRRGLRQMRIVATGLLVVAAVVFLATVRFTDDPVIGYVNAAAEAGMVGALADWFAVVALFRHPLGIPVPHTALVKRRKNELGRSLQDFVTANFLTEEIFRERLAQANVPQRLGEWLAGPEQRRRVLTEVVRGVRSVLGRMSDDDVSAVVTEALIPRLKREELAPVAGAFLEGFNEDKAHHGLVDLALDELADWLSENPDAVSGAIGERAPKWAPKWVNRRVVSWGYGQAMEWIQEVRTDPEHRARQALDELIGRLAVDLQRDPVIRERAENLKLKLLSHPQIAATAVSLWGSLRTSLLHAMEDETSSLWRRGDGWLAELGERLRTDDALRATVETRLSDAVGFLITTYGSELATVISYTVERWDATEASRRIELFVGRDLQFIRINGTVVGALAGVVIHTVSLAVG